MSEHYRQVQCSLIMEMGNDTPKTAEQLAREFLDNLGIGGGSFTVKVEGEPVEHGSEIEKAFGKHTFVEVNL